MNRARTLMVQGTASSVGKSVFVTALCRILRQRGTRVAPFKSQNMSLNAAVTDDGKEISRAQAVQAEAAGVKPTADMNPILLKPEAEGKVQVIVLGKVIGRMSVAEYDAYKPELRPVVASCLERLRHAYDVVVIEGAGSPAEINLRDREIVNMHVAAIAEAPVILVGDIDRGGVFASLVGTLDLLAPHERARVRALVVNRFRGAVASLDSALQFLTQRTGMPILGVIPHISTLGLADEDSVALDEPRHHRRATTGEIDIAVVKTPCISNYDDVSPFEQEPGVVVRFTDEATEIPGADLLILPGSKSTVADLGWLRETGIAAIVTERAVAGRPVLGICGGCQMLGITIEDIHGVESTQGITPGLGLLPLTTRFATEKTTARVRAAALTHWFRDSTGPLAIDGYEIHAGQTDLHDPGSAAFEILERNKQSVKDRDGAVRDAVMGTLIHGLFENEAPRRALLQHLRQRRGLMPLVSRPMRVIHEDNYDRLAAVVRASIDIRLLSDLIGLTDP